ncbi:hypothetical protein ACLOJK_013189 [Asimina triloba]
MSKIAKSKIEKTKVQVVFRLQFHATRIPRPGWDKLLVSFIPADSGKAAAKTAKANVRNGNCKWSDPIYETTRLLQDAETKKYDEKFYKLVVSMAVFCTDINSIHHKGSSRMSLGEAKINLADYAESSKPSTIVLPLQGCSFGTILHVRIAFSKIIHNDNDEEDLTSLLVSYQVTNSRLEFEQQRELRAKGFRKTTNSSVHDDPDVEAEPLAEATDYQIDEVNARTQWESDSSKPSYMEEKGELNEGCVNSAVGHDDSPQTLKGFHVEKYNGSTSCHAEVCALVDSKTGIDDSGKNVDDGSVHDLLVRFQKELFLMEDTLREIQNKVHIKYQEKDLAFLKPDLEMLEYVLHNLKGKTSQVIPFENMTQKERISLSIKEVEVLNELAVQGDALEQQTAECRHFRDMFGSSGTPHLISQDLDHRQNNLEVSNKTSEWVSEILSQLEKSKAECETLRRKTAQIECHYKRMLQDLKESEKQLLDELQHLRDEHSSCVYTIDDLKGRMERMRQDMNEQLQRYTEDWCKLDDVNKELEKRVMASETTFSRVHRHYSISVGQLLKDLELLSFQVTSLFETNNKVSWQPFVEASETYSDFIEECPDKAQSCLQEDGSESAIQKEQHETNLHAIQEDTTILREAGENGEELECDGDHTAERMFPSLKEGTAQAETICQHNECTCVHEQLVCPCENADTKLLKEGVFFGEVESPIHLQKVLRNVTEQEISENFMMNLISEVFSNVLQETLCEVNVGIGLMRKKMGELAQQLEDSTEVKESLMLKLQTALGDMETLRESEAGWITKCNELSSENLSLETKLKSISDENNLFTQKVMECQRLVDESRTYISKYEACSVEKNELEDVLKQEREEKGCLHNEIVSLAEELKALKEEFDKQSSVKDGLEKNVTFLRDRLEDLRSRMVSNNKETNGHVLASTAQLDSEDKNFTTIFWHLEELQQSAYTQVLRLKEDNIEMKQKLESEVREIEAKLDVANAQVKKLQLELQDVENRLLENLEVAEKHAEENIDLSSKLRLLEVELQHVTMANKELNQKIQTLDSIDTELESKKLTTMDLGQESKALVMSQHAAIEDPLHLEDPRVMNVLLHSNECRGKVDEDALILHHRVMDLDADLDVMHEYLLAAEVEVIFAENQFRTRIQELLERLNSSGKCSEATLWKHLDVINKLNGPLGKMKRLEENAELTASVHLMKLEPETNIKEKSFEEERSSLGGEFEKHNKSMVVLMESEASQEKHGHAVETEQLKAMGDKEQLESIRPLFEEFSRSGHALESVLGLEIEPAKALHAEKKSATCIQSSFPEQYNDDEWAIFKSSFRGLKDLIKEMPEIKRRHAAVEVELKDMQERYSQLSLQFAEVEGERQQLIMELKNVKAAFDEFDGGAYNTRDLQARNQSAKTLRCIHVGVALLLRQGGESKASKEVDCHSTGTHVTKLQGEVSSNNFLSQDGTSASALWGICLQLLCTTEIQRRFYLSAGNWNANVLRIFSI